MYYRAIMIPAKKSKKKQADKPSLPLGRRVLAAIAALIADSAGLGYTDSPYTAQAVAAVQACLRAATPLQAVDEIIPAAAKFTYQLAMRVTTVEHAVLMLGTLLGIQKSSSGAAIRTVLTGLRPTPSVLCSVVVDALSVIESSVVNANMVTAEMDDASAEEALGSGVAAVVSVARSNPKLATALLNGLEHYTSENAQAIRDMISKTDDAKLNAQVPQSLLAAAPEAIAV